MRILLTWACGLAISCLLMAGCGGGYEAPEGVVVAGKVLQGGKPLEVPRRDVGLGSVEVLLVPVGGTPGTPVATNANEDGSFEISGAGGGIPPGRYRVAVYQRDQGWGSDMLQGAFSEAASPIEVDVSKDNLGDTQDLGVIELNDHKK